MICPSCAFENEAGAKFCNECGSALAAGCPNCGAPNRPGAKFCNECGTQLGTTLDSAVAPGSAHAAAVAERRLVTVLFTDIVGFTPFAEERDAEDVRDTLSRYFELCAEVIGRYGGTVEKYIGDAVMAVWGAPLAHEDDAERAVRAALDLVGRVGTIGPEIRARAGVLTGEAAVTLGAVNQGLVAGDLVNTCARLQSVAEPGTVLVGETTMRASSNAIVYEQVADQSLKGKQAPIPAWRAVRVVAEVGGRNRSDQLEAPFVGRADELRLLEDLFHATGREHKIRLVSVIGPAGIGKSRLAWEFSKYTDGLVEGIYWHSGRCPAYGEGITFWALGEMIRERCGLVETDDEATTRAKVAQSVEQWVPDGAEREWITPALLTLLGIDSGVASDQLFAAWRTFFERIASHGTVALVFEDMHLADSGLLDFIDHMLEWSRGAPIYIVTLARPELVERRTDWGAAKRAFTSIYLEPLSDQHMHELLAGLVPGLPDAAADAIVARADGVPMYAVETVRMLLADGRLVQRDGFFEPADDLTKLAVPETLAALIASRLDSLDPTDRALMHDAAVLGKSFSVAALGAVSGIPAAELEQRTGTLIRRELLTREADPRSPERGQLTFVQSLIREVAYNTLARRDRKARHLAAARYFEQVGSGELAGALASHYLAAYRNAAEGPEAEALAAQTRVALRAAAERAAALGAHDQAVTFLEQALEVTPDEVEQAAILERAGDAARTAVRPAAREYYERAAAIHGRTGNRLGAASVARAIGAYLLTERFITAAHEFLEGAWNEYRDLWPAEEAILLRVLMSRARGQLGDMPASLQIADEALEAAEHHGLMGPLVEAMVAKGATLGGTGRFRESLALLDAAEKLARDIGRTETLLASLLIGGYVRSEVDLTSAFSKNQEGLELARRTGQRALLYTFVNNIGFTGFQSGDWDAALEIMESALADDDVPRSHTVWLGGNACSIRASRGEDVTELFAKVNRLAEEGGENELLTAAFDAAGFLYLATDRLAEAREAWRRIVATDPSFAAAGYSAAGRPDLWRGDLAALREDLADFNAAGVHSPIADARRAALEAGVAALEGRVADALVGFRAAAKGFSDTGMVFEAALVGVDMAVSLGPEHADAQIVRSGREALERLGARPYVERLDAALAATVVTASQ